MKGNILILVTLEIIRPSHSYSGMLSPRKCGVYWYLLRSYLLVPRFASFTERPVQIKMSKRKLHKWSIDFTGIGRPKGEKAIVQLNTDLRKPIGNSITIQT